MISIAARGSGGRTKKRRESKNFRKGHGRAQQKSALPRAPLALTVPIDLSASDGEQGETRVGEGRGGEGGDAPEAVSLP